MRYSSTSIEAAIEALSSLPTIGRKSAQRLALHLLRQPRERVEALARALLDMKDQVILCGRCFNLTEQDPCAICSSPKRDRSVVCVVEEPSDLLAIERTNEYFGLYHVLHGSLNPLDGIGPDELKIRELLPRLNDSVREVILAMNPNTEGEVTTQYLMRIMKSLDVKVSRIARGIPIGSDLELADDATISRALQGRIQL